MGRDVFRAGHGRNDFARSARRAPAANDAFFIDGDNHRSANNVAVVIPPGVAHAVRVEGLGGCNHGLRTSTPFNPEFEGRIASDVKAAILPESWQRFWRDASDKARLVHRSESERTSGHSSGGAESSK